jgi:hypothetical protein
MEWAGRTLVPEARDAGFSSARPVVRCMVSEGEFMTNRLQELLDEARKNVSTSQEKEEQRPSI